LSGLELVDLGVARSESTLGDTVNTVLGCGGQLAKTVPVDRCTVCLHVVVDSNLDVVTPVGTDERTGKLVVDEEAAAAGRSSIRVAGGVCDGECVVSSDTSGGPLLVKVGVDAETGRPTVSRCGGVDA